MKKILKIVAAAAAAIGLCSIRSLAGPAVDSTTNPAATNASVASGQKIATIDLAKVFGKYYKTIRSTTALKEEAAEMQKQRKALVDAGKKQEEEWQKLIDKADDQAISAEERARSKKAAEDKLREVKTAEENIQEYDRASANRLHERERTRRDDIVKEIRGVLNAEAKAGGYTLVLDVSGESANMAPVVLFSSGVNDLTDSLIKELNAGAPSMPADEKTAKEAKDTTGVK